MPRDVKVKEGQCFQDGTGLTVRVAEIDANDRVHFSVIEDQGVAGSGDMPNSAFVSRFSRIEAVQSACARIRHLGYVAYRNVRIYGEEFELLSDPFPENNRVAIRAKAKGESKVQTLRLPQTMAQGRQGRRMIRRVS
jgi:hypothetical protein